jgi:hypothetical protein
MITLVEESRLNVISAGGWYGVQVATGREKLDMWASWKAPRKGEALVLSSSLCSVNCHSPEESFHQ